MKKRIFTVIIALAILLLSVFTLTGCGFFDNSSDNNSNDNSSQDEELKIPEVAKSEYNAGFNYASSVVIDKEDVPTEERDITLENNEDYDIEYRKVKATYSYDDLCAMGADNDILYPGAIVDVTDDRYSPLYVDRAPLTISVNLESMLNSTGKLYSEIKNPNLSSVRTGIRKIVSENVGIGDNVLPAKISMDIREVSNEREFYLNVGFGLQVKKLNIAENFSYNNVKRQTNMVIVLKQEYYTVDVDYKGERGLFAQSLTNADINKQFEGKVPAYVSSVSYGRIAFISIQTNYSKDEIANALAVSWGKMSKNPGTSAIKNLSAELDTDLKKIAKDNETTISYYVYGGGVGVDGAMGSITTNSADAICNLFESFNAADSVGLPISYKLRDFSGSIVDIHGSDEYTVKDVTYNPKKIMDWSYLNDLIKDGYMSTKSKIKIDLSEMVDYSDPSETNNNAQRTIVIPSNVTEFTLIGPNDLADSIVYNNLSIQVAYRSNDNPLTILLSKISFIANCQENNSEESNGVAIFSDNSALVELKIDGNVSVEGVKNAIECDNLRIGGSGIFKVKGGAGVDASKTDESGGDGYIAVKSKSLDVQMKGKLLIYGGNGGNGHDGESFNRDSTSEDQNVHGKNGSNGGKGGAALCVDSLIYSPQCAFIVTGGTGGNGGRGGNGQGSHVDNKNGRSGNGGNGGRGGNGGNAIECKNITIANSDSAECLELIGGSGGSGGNGGHGGNGHVEREWTVIVVADKSDYSGNGGNGGNGGDGGFSYYSESETTITNRANIVIKSSIGGSFGAGGDGGKCKNNESFEPGDNGINGNVGDEKTAFNLIG